MAPLAAFACPAYKARLAGRTRHYAAKPPTAGRVARCFARTWRGEIRRRLVLCEIRRHSCAGDRDSRREAAAVAQGPGPRLDSGGIRHVAGRHLGAAKT